ncbi:MAG: tetraacyldisaccharide 4'-kinase, partial [Polaromonas sp.]|uniref:tetraacyldisaccharide 4'-kinase n=1 Tax=Polaromonas sp. TaxID=1869339 RepID=UPI004036F802
GWLLPAGPLREPWPPRLQRGAGPDGRGIDLVLHTGAQPAFDGFHSTRRLADHALRGDGSRVALDSLTGAALIALAGIARPQAFFDMLRASGLALAETRALPDHYDFDSYPRPSDMGYTLICTEKDAVKLFPRQAGALAVPLVFEPEPAFFAAFDALLAPLLSPLPSSHGHQTA